MTAEPAGPPGPVRSPVTSIELTLEDELDAAVRGEWEALQRAGFSSLAAHTAPSNRPHVTLLARHRIDPFGADDLADRLPLPVTLGAPTLFGTGGRRVLARIVVPSTALLDLHTALHRRVGPGDDLSHTTPGTWLPHVTLARRIRLDELAAALPLLGADLPGDLVGLRRWDPVEQRITDLGR